MTKQERNILYKRMLKIYRKFLKSGKLWGICATIREIAEKDNKFYNISKFDELMNYQPELFYDCFNVEVDDSSQFWFLVKDTKSRIDLLKKVIKETN